MRVGFAGLGTMGAAMASHLVADHDVVVHDVRASAAEALVDAGARWAPTVADLVADREVLLTSLPGPAEVDAVATAPGGVLEAAPPGLVHLDLSTNAWASVRSLAQRYEARALHFLDAPVSGGPSGAASRRLAIWAGGDEQAFRRARPVLDGIADRVAHVGEVGSGTVVKLVHNATGNTINLVLTELFVLADAAGVDPVTLWGHVRQGAIGRRRTFDSLAAQFLPQRYDPPALALGLARKDMGLLLALADEVDLDVPRARATVQRMDDAVARGWADRDSRVTMLVEQLCLGHELAPATQDAIAAVLAADPLAADDVRHRHDDQET